MKLKLGAFKINYTILLAAITLLGLFLRLYRLGYHDLWYDEACSVIKASDINHFFKNITGNTHPPLYNIILHYWTKLFSFSELSVRLPSAMAGIFSIPLIYKVGTHFYSKKIGILSAFFLSISPLHVWYSQEARMYSLSVFAILIMVLFFLRLTEEYTTLNWIIFAIISEINLCLNYFSLLILVAALVFILFEKYPGIKKLFFYALLITVLNFPIILLMTKHFLKINSIFWIPLRSPQEIVIIIASLFLGYTAGHLDYTIIIAICLLMIFVWLKKVKCIKKEFLLFNYSIAPLLILALISLLAPILLPRYIILFSPFLYILIASALLRLKKKIITTTLCFLLIILMASSLFNYFNDYMPNEMTQLWGCYIKKPFKPLINLIRNNMEKGDIVAHSHPSTLFPFLYYFRDTPTEQMFLTIYNNQDPYSKKRYYPGSVSKRKKFPYKIKELGTKRKFYPGKRLWLISSSWKRDGSIDYHSESVLQIASQRFRKIIEFHDRGILLSLFSIAETK